MKRVLLRLAWLLLFASACASALPPATASPTTPGTASSTGTASRLYTLTPTPRPIRTKGLSDTPEPTQSPWPTPPPYEKVLASPSGRLFAGVRFDLRDEKSPPILEVWDSSGKVVRTLPYQGGWDAWVAPCAMMYISGWSADGRQVYFHYEFHYDWGAPTFGYVRDLQSLDVSTGETRTLLPGPLGGPTDFAFSADRSKVAYVAGERVGILDLKSGVRKSIPVLVEGFDDAGWVFLSPDTGKLIYHVTKVEGYPYMVLLDLRSMQQEVVLRDGALYNYEFDGWTADGNPRYRDLVDQTLIVVDLETHEKILLGTVTPEP